jgi:hypothetical protein
MSDVPGLTSSLKYTVTKTGKFSENDGSKTIGPSKMKKIDFLVL